MSIVVRHNIAAHRFEAGEAGDLAVCDYEDRDGVWYFTHTYVPDSLRGQRVAGKLVEFALETALRERKKIVPACSYVSAFLGRKPKYEILRYEG